MTEPTDEDVDSVTPPVIKLLLPVVVRWLLVVVAIAAVFALGLAL